MQQADSGEEKNKLLGFLHKISEGFSATVNHLNEITKTQNLSGVKPERLNLFACVEKTKATLLVQIESGNATILNNVDKDIELTVNPAYMDSILLNLLTNAMKYRHPDRPSVIELTGTRKYGKIVFKVRDNGRGIDLRKHGNDLFGLYKTFHGNKDAEGRGLFMTKYQIESMGGQVEVESEENVGTTFGISFNAV
jgi:K+-sensing histidine kinase KdpD